MIDPEKSYPALLQNEIVLLATQYSGADPDRNELSYIQAVDFLNQHQRKLIGALPKNLSMFTRKWDGVANIAGGFVKTMREGDLDFALYLSNLLYFCGETEVTDGLAERRAQKVSLLAHRALQTAIFEQYRNSDSYLQRNGTTLESNLRVVRRHGTPRDEITVIRVIVHNVALNKTLGQFGYRYADPIALIQPKL